MAALRLSIAQSEHPDVVPTEGDDGLAQQRRRGRHPSPPQRADPEVDRRDAAQQVGPPTCRRPRSPAAQAGPRRRGHPSTATRAPARPRLGPPPSAVLRDRHRWPRTRAPLRVARVTGRAGHRKPRDRVMRARRRSTSATRGSSIKTPARALLSSTSPAKSNIGTVCDASSARTARVVDPGREIVEQRSRVLPAAEPEREVVRAHDDERHLVLE